MEKKRKLGRIKRTWYLSPMRAAKVQASLRIRAVSPEPPLLAHTRSESRGTFRQKARSLAPLNGWACAVKICHDRMLEDTNPLIITKYPPYLFYCYISGPTALVQFHIWSCGDIEMSVLKDKLLLSLKHALCDVMMEYYILTAPICEIPKCLQELSPLPTMSAPSSPYFSSGS